MSRKPPKKSDMGKSWMKPRRDSRQMISPEYHLIVSEGTKTEPKYFEKIKETIDAKYRDRIHLDISGKGDNTVNLFNRAVKDVAGATTFINMSGWSLTRTISRLSTLTVLQSYVPQKAQTKPGIILYGPTSASSYGFCSISCSCRRTSIGMNTGRNLPKA